MSPIIRRMLWGAFIGLAVLTAGSVALTIGVLQMEQRNEFMIVQESRPLLDAIDTMDESLSTMVSAARGYTLNRQTAFEQQYEDAAREFNTAQEFAVEHARDERDRKDVRDFINHYAEVKKLTDRQNELTEKGEIELAKAVMANVAKVRRTAPDYDSLMTERIRNSQGQVFEKIASLRQWVMMSMVFLGLGIIVVGAIAVTRIEEQLVKSLNRQVRRTEAMIAGMSDGVLLVDGEGRTVFINPAGQRLLGTSEIAVPITKQAEAYRLRDQHGRILNPQELPAAQALSTGRAVHDMTIIIARDETVAVSMSATPLHEDGQISSVIVTFRDITERRAFEEEMQMQAERAQILADAGAFFASNIDPNWVTQAIAERVAEVLGDWSAIILRNGTGPELTVASIYHRDMASLGLAWSYIYRQPLVVGEGIIGQVVSSGYPSLTTNVRAISDSKNPGTYHPSPVKLASLLILPLRTRREVIGALVIAANDPDRAMTDEKLPLAELLAERASLAIENARLYTEQVEARHKLEDLSRLKDEFLSIASHELRTPVTSIKGYTQLSKMLIKEGDLTTSEEYLDIALDQIDRMSRLILELLDVSRIETGRLEIRREPIAWAHFVRDIVHHHHTSVSDRRFHLSVPDDGKVVVGDRDRLEQVLGNLLENAVKYSPDGSDVTVTVEDKGDSFVTAVCDRGIGIPSDELAQVFERFHRGRHVSSTNYGGLGLGLYITKQIIERHGGTIWVDSKEGHGTTFFFSLPAEERSAGAKLLPPQDATVSSR
ncbi:MAG TPA: ATP-binding protein [Thermoanaerobaculia bacterium]|nr:ATP-binding protein [Thermoanaerobaculia bacterium]